MKFLLNDYIVQTTINIYATELISQTGGSDGIRDNTLLDSALAAPFLIQRSRNTPCHSIKSRWFCRQYSILLFKSTILNMKSFLCIISAFTIINKYFLE